MSEITVAMVEEVAFAMARVIAYRHGGCHVPDDWMNDERREEARAAIAAMSEAKLVEGDAVALLREMYAVTAEAWPNSPPHAGEPYRSGERDDKLRIALPLLERYIAALSPQPDNDEGIERVRASVKAYYESANEQQVGLWDRETDGLMTAITPTLLTLAKPSVKADGVEELEAVRESASKLLAAVERTPKHLRMPAEVEAADALRAALGGGQ